MLTGTSTSALYAGGADGGSYTTVQAYTEQWNGSSWTEVGDLNTARFGLQGGRT